MSVFSLRNAILLGGAWEGHLMVNGCTLEKAI
jgi:hypothetical protein